MKSLDPLTVSLSGTTLIEASAGTGKTYTITTLYLRLLLERRLEVAQILVVTYTNAATAELRDRIRRRLRDALVAFRERDPAGDETLEALLAASRARDALDRDRDLLASALRSFDEAAIFTIHGFCQRMLQDNAFESGVSFDAELVTTEDLLREEVVRDFWAREVLSAPEILVRHLEEEGVTLETFLFLVKRAVQNPKMRVLPDPEDVDVDGAHERLRTAYAAAEAIWRRERATVLGALLDARRLKASMYAPKSIPEWGAEMELELASARPGIRRRFEKFRKFTNPGLREATKKGSTPPGHPFFDACDELSAADEGLGAALSKRVLRLKLDLVSYARRELPRRKAAANSQSFDDLLHLLADALAAPRGATLGARIGERYRAALIDEFQDTDQVQYEIFRRVYVGDAEGALFVIGDPKQAIYSFRGADVFTYMSARNDAGDRQYTLGTNWRSDPKLIAAIRSLFLRPKNPFLFEEIPFIEVEPRQGATESLGGAGAGAAPLEVLLLPGDEINWNALERLVPERLAAEVSGFLRSGATLGGRPVEPGDIAVLCRTNEQARESQRALRALRVPSVLQGDSSVFDTPEAEEVERVLEAMADPHDAAALRSALATTLIGLGAQDLLGLRTDEPAWDDRVQRFLDWSEIWARRGFVPAFLRMLDVEAVRRRLLELADGERRLTNVLHVGELLQGAAAETRRGPLALVEWLHRMRLDPTMRGDLAAEATQIRLESDAHAVRLTTIHQAKGLEYPIVYCPFLWGKLFEPRAGQGSRFHDPNDGQAMKLDLGSADRERHLELHLREEFGENLRLLYVALTRAKHRCTIVWGSFKGAESSALGYLFHGPSDLPAGVTIEELGERVAARIGSGASVRADLEGIAGTTQGAIAIREIGSERGEPFDPPRRDLGPLACRVAGRMLTTRFRISSFTGLVASRGTVSEPSEEGIDHDQTADGAAADAVPAAEASPVVLHEFPRGARAGDLVHAVLERLDFANADRAAIDRAVETALVRHGFEPRWTGPLAEAVTELLDTDLGGGASPIRLRQLALERRRSEMGFVFPVSPHGGVGLSSTGLAEVFERHGAPRALPGYAGRLRGLGFEPLAGFLRGFIDLVFEHEGRWYVVDYKSNFLGPAPCDYGAKRMAAAMADHDYFLQYHVYAVALDRHLRARSREYDRSRDFGGVYYLFVRGMSPGHPPGTGVFFDRPSPALIGELSSLFGEER